MRLCKVRVTLNGGPRNGQVLEMERPKPGTVLLRVVGDPHKPNGVARYELDSFGPADRDVTARFVCYMDPLPSGDAP